MTEPRLPHLHLSPANFTPIALCFPLDPDGAMSFSGMIEGETLCQGLVGEAKAGTFCSLHDDTMFVIASTGKYYYELQRLGQFEVGDAVRVVLRGGKLAAEKISLDELMETWGTTPT